MTRALRSIAIALGTWALVGACAFAIYRGVTQPGARLLGIGNGGLGLANIITRGLEAKPDSGA